MRSKTAKRIYSETPDKVKDEVREATKSKTFEKGTDPVLLDMFISEVVETVYVPIAKQSVEAVTKHKYIITITKVEE